ncbi:hypothetical protein GGS24DRAFT_333320 [Hypoxylon argillaceum]|nr:hypothetical protein GGS24DRAFT_333320 [Hypoxylon argillaceum]
MRSAIVLIAASSCAHAAWLRWSANREEIWAAQETNHVAGSNQIGWTPKPTPAPGARSEGEVVMDLLRRQTSTKWENSETCGWFSGISSSAFTCGDGFTCGTNSDHVVACVSGTFSPFYKACLDFSAFQAGSCSNLDAATGCCQSAAEPACGTWIWTGSPERFMYQCFETASIVSMLDVPQFVIDASIFSKTHTTPTPTVTSSKTANTDSGSPSGGSSGGNAGGSNAGGSSGSGTADPASGSTTGTPSGSSNTSNSTPVIVGSVIGGIAGLLFLLLLLLFCLRRKTKGKLGLGFTRKKKSKKEDNSSKAYHNTKVMGAAAKGRNSSGSDPITVIPVPMQQQQQQQQQPQHYYHNQEQHHYHPVSQVQPQFQPQQQPQQLNLQQHQYQQPPPPAQNQDASRGQQPVSMSYTVNEGTTHVSQPSHSRSTSYTNMQATMMPSSSDESSRFLVGGILPIVHSSNDKQQHQQPQPQPQPYYQQQQQQPQPQFQQYPQQLQQQQPQQQPVNHIHVYYAPPPSSQVPAPAPESQERGTVVPNALGLFTHLGERTQAGSASQERSQPQQTERGRERSRGRSPEREQGDIPAYYSHSRDPSDISSSSRRNRSPSRDSEGEWMASRGPGYRQSF